MKDLVVIASITDPLSYPNDLQNNDKDAIIENLKARLREANQIAMKAIKLAKSTAYSNEYEVAETIESLETAIAEVPVEELKQYLVTQFDSVKCTMLKEDPPLCFAIQSLLLNLAKKHNFKPLEIWEKL